MGEKYAKNKVFLNLKRNLVINIITWICSITKIYIVWCVPVQMLCLEKCYFWDMVQNAPSQCNCKIFKSTVSQEQIDVTDSFFACYYKFMKIKSWLKIYWSGMFTCSLFWISVTWLISSKTLNRFISIWHFGHRTVLFSGDDIYQLFSSVEHFFVESYLKFSDKIVWTGMWFGKLVKDL